MDMRHQRLKLRWSSWRGTELIAVGDAAPDMKNRLPVSPDDGKHKHSKSYVRLPSGL